MVEHLLAKEGVEGSNPFFRSTDSIASSDPRSSLLNETDGVIDLPNDILGVIQSTTTTADRRGHVADNRWRAFATDSSGAVWGLDQSYAARRCCKARLHGLQYYGHALCQERLAIMYAPLSIVL